MSVGAVPVQAPRKWRVRLFVGVALLATLLWAAPMIASWTPLVEYGCQQAGEHFDGCVHVGNASLGWFSPVVLSNVEIRDANGKPFVQIPRVETDRSLLRLLWNRDDLGTIRLEKLKVDWVFRGHSSNIESAIEKALKKTAAPSTDSSAAVLPGLELQILDATLHLRDEDTNQEWNITGLALKAELPNDDEHTVRIDLKAKLTDGQDQGNLLAEATVNHLNSNNLSAIVKGRFTSFPLNLANVMVRRFEPGAVLSGSLNGQGNLHASFKDGKPLIELVGETVGNRIQVTSPFLAEPFVSNHVKAPFAILINGDIVTAQRIEVESDFGKMALQGAYNPSAAWLNALEQPNFELDVDVNLATLAERLPKTLRLHNDLRLTAGQLKLHCKSQARNGQVIWIGNVNASEVRGIRGAQTVQWAEPITLDFQARDLSKGVPLIDRLNCNARFLRIEGSTSAERFVLRAEADLQKLAEPLGQFIDLGELKLAGKASGIAVVQRGEKDQFLVQGDVQVKQLNLAWLTREPLQEDSAALTFEAIGKIDSAGRQRIDDGKLEVKFGSDTATLKITEPIADLAAGPWGMLSARLDGDLARWQRRARCVTKSLDDWKFAGSAGIQLHVRASAQSVECPSITVQARDFRCNGVGLRINEPTLNLQTAARWDVKSGAIELAQTSVNCTTLQADAAKLSLNPATLAAAGNINVKGDLARLRQWTQDPSAKASEPVAGTLTAKVQVQTAGQRVTADLDGAIANLTYGPSAKPTWRETEVKCTGRATYDVAKDQLTIEKMAVASSLISADATGTIGRLTTTTDLDLAGTLTYDLEKLEPQLRPLLGKDVKIAGKDRRAFKIAGPLYPPAKVPIIAVGGTAPTISAPTLSFRELKGEASTHWTSLKALGCEVGAAEVKAIIQQGWIQVYPIETTLNTGKLRVQPNLRLEPEPMELVLQAGQPIDRAKITPQMCASAIGYALPLLANVTAAEGAISVSLEGARIPVAAPTTSEIKGTLTLHSAKVGPNPIIRELTGLLKMAPPTCTVKESAVPFHMVNGKVHHSNLEITLNDFNIRSSGAVGLDGSLALTIEMPIPPRLATAARLTPAQAKQLLRIPVGGTLEQPRLDPRAIESLTAILGRSFLENELNKLLQPKR